MENTEKNKTRNAIWSNAEAVGRKSCRFQRWWIFRSFSAPTSPLTSSFQFSTKQNVSTSSLSPLSTVSLFSILFLTRKAFLSRKALKYLKNLGLQLQDFPMLHLSHFQRQILGLMG